MNTSFILKDNDIVMLTCCFHNIYTYEPIPAGVMIRKSIKIRAEKVFFSQLLSIYPDDIFVGPALDLSLCSASVSRCCFNRCYGPKAGTFRILCFCSSFDLNAQIFCGFYSKNISIHPSYFDACLVLEHAHNNISKSQGEYNYFASSQVQRIKYNTIVESNPRNAFSSYNCNVTNRYELSYVINCKIPCFGHQEKCTIEVISCYFINSSGTVSDRGVVFNDCSFTQTAEELNAIKGNAVVNNPHFLKRDSIIQYPFNAACRCGVTTKIQKGKPRVPLVLLLFIESKCFGFD